MLDGILDVYIQLSQILNSLSESLWHWQELLGSLIGAAIPLSLFLLSRLYFEHKDYLELLEKVHVLAINNLADIDEMIIKFRDGNLQKQSDEVGRASAKTHFVGKTFFPLTSTYVFPDEIAKHTTRSNYIDNLVLKAAARSKDLPLMMQDARAQFMELYEIHRQLMQIKQASPDMINININEGLHENLKGYKEFLNDEWRTKNLPTYLHILVEARTALTIYRKLGAFTGWIRWRRRWAPVSFKYFRRRSDIKDWRESARERIEKFLQPKVEEEYAKICKLLKDFPAKQHADTEFSPPST